jgi:hypothetical protein
MLAAEAPNPTVCEASAPWIDRHFVPAVTEPSMVTSQPVMVISLSLLVITLPVNTVKVPDVPVESKSAFMTKILSVTSELTWSLRKIPALALRVSFPAGTIPLRVASRVKVVSAVTVISLAM